MLLRPRHVTFHLRICGFLLQMLNLLLDVASGLCLKIDAQSETAKQGDSDDETLCHEYAPS
jgi:hypothetical protein